jgi:hypothetical protein
MLAHSTLTPRTTNNTDIAVASSFELSEPPQMVAAAVAAPRQMTDRSIPIDIQIWNVECPYQPSWRPQTRPRHLGIVRLDEGAPPRPEVDQAGAATLAESHATPIPPEWLDLSASGPVDSLLWRIWPFPAASSRPSQRPSPRKQPSAIAGSLATPSSQSSFSCRSPSRSPPNCSSQRFRRTRRAHEDFWPAPTHC